MPVSKLNKVREFLNLRIYSSKSSALLVLMFLTFFVSIIAIGSIIYYYGFEKTQESIYYCQLIIRISFAFYIFRFLFRIFYEFSPVQFVKQNFFEALLMVILIISGIVVEISGISFFSAEPEFNGMFVVSSLSILIIQLVFFTILMLDIAKASQRIGLLNLGPSALLALSFIILIFSGAGLLMLPEMTVDHNIRFIDALFTSCSASCVTGLIVVDTATFFTLKGKIIIMILIQLGGLNIITFATYFATFYKSSGLKYQSLMKDLLSSDKVSENRRLLWDIILFSFIMEAIGSITLFFQWGDAVGFTSLRQHIFFSVFHTVSAFNNAGFSLFTDNLYEESIRHLYGLQLTIATLIFFGGLGFSVMHDIFAPKTILDRLKYPWKKLKVNTKLALFTSLILIFVGALMFYILEYDNTVDHSSVFGSIVSSIFQSVTTRTAGYNTVDFTTLGQPILIIMIMLMFIGASPGSTGGGIKTTTFALLFKSAITTLKGKKNIEIFKSNISYDCIDRAYSLLLFAIVLILGSAFLLTITEPDVPFLNLLFEETSAFGTVGLSTGITADLSDAGKNIIVTSMFIGRIGPLTMALLLIRRKGSNNYRYSNANVMIG
jgi:trk system potassium uptake protein